MKSIRRRILITFCPTVTLIIIIIGGLVSWKLEQSISHQSGTLTNDLIIQTQVILKGHNKILASFLDNVRKNVHIHTRDISGSNITLKTLEWNLPKHSVKFLRNSCENSETDFALIYDAEGKLYAAFPETVDKTKADEYYNSLDLKGKFQDLSNRKKDKGIIVTDAITRHDSEFLNAFGLGDRDIAGKGAIILGSAGIIPGKDGNRAGVCVSGKLLNGLDKPFSQLYNATGSAGAFYLDTVPIAYAGFSRNEKEKAEQAALQISPGQMTKVYESESVDNIMKLADKEFVTSSSVMKSDNEKIGIICVGVPLEELKVRNTILSSSITTRDSLQKWICWCGLISLVFFALIALIIATRIEKPIRHVIRGLSDTASVVLSSSCQVSETSRELARGTYEQASASEESASALNEIAATSKDTSVFTQGARQLMTENMKKSVKTVKALVELTEKVALIEKDSDQVGNIIKTIDEIAFQTRLLALNAAVEAARAGETGSGFAVVADEVKNLAIKSAEAAKSTQSLLEAIVDRISESARSINSINADFEGIIKSASVMGGRTVAISKSISEQAYRIEQVNEAVGEMGRIAQQNAAIAENFAGASERLDIQSAQLKNYVELLFSMIGGTDESD